MVKIGDLLVEFDPRAVTAEGYDTTITLLITNSRSFWMCFRPKPARLRLVRRS